MYKKRKKKKKEHPNAASNYARIPLFLKMKMQNYYLSCTFHKYINIEFSAYDVHRSCSIIDED